MRLFLPALVMIAFLTACSSGGRVAPVHHLGAVPHVGPRPSHYTVRGGDTLYSIGWRYGVHYRTLAHWNGIHPPYTIYVGQKLRLNSPSKSADKPKQASENKESVTKPTASPSLTKVKAVPAKKALSLEKPTKVAHGIRWYWPTRGEVIQNFSHTEAGRKGVDITGELGQPVVAVADGKVVYSGRGLPRYGKLIIVKHDANFLSAYAHNRLLVSKEGDSVKGGQKIAEMGRSGTDRVKLHFEIRHHGQPVDPLRYLPK